MKISSLRNFAFVSAVALIPDATPRLAQAQLVSSHILGPKFSAATNLGSSCDFKQYNHEIPVPVASVITEDMKDLDQSYMAGDVVFDVSRTIDDTTTYIKRGSAIVWPSGTPVKNIDPDIEQLIKNYSPLLTAKCKIAQGRFAFSVPKDQFRASGYNLG